VGIGVGKKSKISKNLIKMVKIREIPIEMISVYYWVLRRLGNSKILVFESLGRPFESGRAYQ